MYRRFCIRRKKKQKVENVQGKTTPWMCRRQDDHKNRLLQPNILHVSLYLEPHDILCFNAIQNEKSNIRVKIPTGCTDTRQNVHYEVTRNLFRKTDKKIWTRKVKLFNFISKDLKDFLAVLTVVDELKAHVTSLRSEIRAITTHSEQISQNSKPTVKNQSSKEDYDGILHRRIPDQSPKTHGNVSNTTHANLTDFSTSFRRTIP